jgi:hypothetical protein
MTTLQIMQKGKWRMIQCITSPKKESFVVSTVKYRNFGFESLVFRSSRQGEIGDFRAVYRYRCTNKEEAEKRHNVMCKLLRCGKYIWLDQYDIFFN